MFSQECVKNSVHKGCVYPGRCLCREMSARGYLPRRFLSPGGLKPGGACLRGSWGSVCLQGELGRFPPKLNRHSKQAGGTHPTGMHSCFHTISDFWEKNTSTFFNHVMFLLVPDNKTHPDSIFIFLDNNPFHCDTKMCWIKQGVQDGWLSLQYDPLSSILEPDHWYPDCTNYPDDSWDDVDLECNTE